MTDGEFVASFEACTLPDFTHRDHVRIAWIYLRRLPYACAVDAMEQGVRRFAAHHGAHDKYHHTLTLVWMRLVAAALAEPSDDFEAFLARHPHLLERDAPRRYYSSELLHSAPARVGWVEPDLRALPDAAARGSGGSAVPGFRGSGSGSAVLGSGARHAEPSEPEPTEPEPRTPEPKGTRGTAEPQEPWNRERQD